MAGRQAPNPVGQPSFPQQPVQQRPAQQPMPMFNSTVVRDLTPAIPMTDDFYRRKLTAYEVYTIRPADPIDDGDLQDTKRDQETKRNAKRDKKDKKGSKSSIPPPKRWLRVTRAQENYEQEVILEKIWALDKRDSSITDKKADLSSHMSTHVNNLLDEKNSFEYDSPFTWTLCQLKRITGYNKTTKRKQTETLVLYLKRAPRQDVNPTALYREIEKAKFLRNQPPPPPPPPPPQQHIDPPPQPRARANGPGPSQGKNPGGRFPPAAVLVVPEDPRRAAPAKNGSRDKAIPIERSGPRGKGDKRKSSQYNSDDTRSTRSSGSGSSSGSDSDSGSAYSSETDQTSLISGSSLNRQRRGSAFSHGKGKPVKQHDKEYTSANRARRYSDTVFVPEAPRIRAQSYERSSRNAVDLEQLRTQAFAEGYATAAVNNAIDRAAPQQRTIAFPDDHSQRSSIRSLDGETRTLDDIRADVRLENLRIQDDLPQWEDIQFRDTFRVRDDGMVGETIRLRDDHQFKDNLRFRDDIQFRDNLRFRDDSKRRDPPIRVDIRDLRYQSDLRRAEDTIHRDSLPTRRIRDHEYLRRESVSPLSFDPLPSPRAREFEHRRGGSLPLDYDIPVQYIRNPFAPNERREPPLYRH